MNLGLVSEISDIYCICWISCFLMFKDTICLQATEFQIYLWSWTWSWKAYNEGKDLYRSLWWVQGRCVLNSLVHFFSYFRPMTIVKCIHVETRNLGPILGRGKYHTSTQENKMTLHECKICKFLYTSLY